MIVFWCGEQVCAPLDTLTLHFQTCQFPTGMKIRNVVTKQESQSDGPQVYALFNAKNGFKCLHNMQPKGAKCIDYEIQLTCCDGIDNLHVLVYSLKVF